MSLFINPVIQAMSVPGVSSVHEITEAEKVSYRAISMA